MRVICALHRQRPLVGIEDLRLVHPLHQRIPLLAQICILRNFSGAGRVASFDSLLARFDEYVIVPIRGVRMARLRIVVAKDALGPKMQGIQFGDHATRGAIVRQQPAMGGIDQIPFAAPEHARRNSLEGAEQSSSRRLCEG